MPRRKAGTEPKKKGNPGFFRGERADLLESHLAEYSANSHSKKNNAWWSEVFGDYWTHFEWDDSFHIEAVQRKLAAAAVGKAENAEEEDEGEEDESRDGAEDGPANADGNASGKKTSGAKPSKEAVMSDIEAVCACRIWLLSQA
jgi:hypothetical protein